MDPGNPGNPGILKREQINFAKRTASSPYKKTHCKVIGEPTSVQTKREPVVVFSLPLFAAFCRCRIFN